MGSLTKSWKAQTLNVFGPTPSTKWAGYNWGSGSWGYKSVGAGNLPALTIQVGVSLTVLWTGSNRVTPVYSNSNKQLLTGNDYSYQFVDRVTNAESAAASPGYALYTVGTGSYTSAAAQTTTWSPA